MKRAVCAAAIGVVLAVSPGASVLAHKHGVRGPGGEVMQPDEKPTVIPGGRGSVQTGGGTDLLSECIAYGGQGTYSLDWLRACYWMGTDYADDRYPGGRPNWSGGSQQATGSQSLKRSSSRLRDRHEKAARRGENCCEVVSKDLRQRTVTVRNKATGRTFRVSVKDARQLRNLAPGRPLGMGTRAEVGQSRQGIQSDRQRQIQPRSRILPGGGRQEFECRGGTCRCEGTKDCVDMAESGVCSDRILCDRDKCYCSYEGTGPGPRGGN